MRNDARTVDAENRPDQEASMLGLRDGFEPDAPAEDSLSRAAVLAHIASVRIMADSVDVPVFERERWIGMDAGGENPFANLVVAHGALDHDTVGEIDATIASPHVIFSPTLSSDLRDTGYQLMGHPPLMFRPPGGNAPTTPDGWETREIAAPEDMEPWRETCAQAYPIPSLQGTRWIGEGAVGSAFRFFLGTRDGVPLATSAACIAHGVNLVTFVATMPEARGSGGGEALTWLATLADPTLPGMLIASDSGRPIYERMGYHAMTRWTLWYRPTSRR